MTSLSSGCVFPQPTVSGEANTISVIQDGVHAWNDRAYTLRNVPPELVGDWLAQLPHRSKGSITVSPGKPCAGSMARVYVAVSENFRDGRLTRSLPAASWTRPSFAENRMSWDQFPLRAIFYKDVPKGSSIALPDLQGECLMLIIVGQTGPLLPLRDGCNGDRIILVGVGGVGGLSGA